MKISTAYFVIGVFAPFSKDNPPIELVFALSPRLVASNGTRVIQLYLFLSFKFTRFLFRSSFLLSLNPHLEETRANCANTTTLMLVKKGRHLSKSTYHFFTPLTVFFSGKIAKGGHASSHHRKRNKNHRPHDSGLESASVRTADNLNDDPNLG